MGRSRQRVFLYERRHTRAEVARYWWGKALTSLEAARRDAAAGGYAYAINRAYYTLFYAVSALLLEEGRRFTKHSGVRAVFNQDIVSAGRLSREYGDLYNQLFRDRKRGITSHSRSLTRHMSKRKFMRAKNS